MKYTLLEKNKVSYICIVLLNEIINNQVYPPVVLMGEDVFIDHYLKLLHSNGMLSINNDAYIPTELGRAELEKFYQKYSEYLRLFDIFCAVDLEEGNFAFEEINNPSFNDEQWYDYLSNERFSDVRVAVADFKGLNPIEIVFMSFLTEGRFTVGIDRWQYNLTADAIWKEIEEICNTAISREYLEKDGVLEDVIKQGSVIALDLIKEADEINLGFSNEEIHEIFEQEEVEVVEEYVEVVESPIYGYDYYEPYYDPFYISPIWLVPVLLF
jgi:hypothetical protein